MHKDRNTLARELGFDSYAAYLKSALWDRNKAAARKPLRCWICGSTQNLHHHHRTYERLGRELADDLIVLCERHHSGLHDFIRRHRLDLFDGHERYRIYLAQNTKVVGRRSKPKQTYLAPTAGMRSSVRRKQRAVAPVTIKRIPPS